MEDSPKNKNQLSPSVKVTRKAWKPVSIGFLAAVILYIANNLGGKDLGRLEGYPWRMLIKVNEEFVAGDQTLADFPVLLELELEDLKSVAHGGKVSSSKGEDIRFTNDVGATPLPYRIKSYDPKSGKLTAWVGVDSLYANKPSYFFIYFGKENATTQLEFSYEGYPFKGFFMDGGKAKQAKKAKDYSSAWIETEMNNQDPEKAFIGVGPVDELDTEKKVNYGYFRANLKGGKLILIEWSADKEINNKYFFVERSQDGRFYESMGKLAGGGNNNFTLRYSYSDSKPFEGGGLYRLKQVQKNGSFIYTEPISTAYDLADKGIQIKDISPNPFNDFFVAEFEASKEQQAEIIIYNGKGETIENHRIKVKKGANNFIFKDVYDLPKGPYVFSLQGEDQKLKIKEVKKTYDRVSAR
ncbi:MAG: DUF2341 domain-containing protein [Bacteroidota bacterium]